MFGDFQVPRDFSSELVPKIDLLHENIGQALELSKAAQSRYLFFFYGTSLKTTIGFYLVFTQSYILILS